MQERRRGREPAALPWIAALSRAIPPTTGRSNYGRIGLELGCIQIHGLICMQIQSKSSVHPCSRASLLSSLPRTQEPVHAICGI